MRPQSIFTTLSKHKIDMWKKPICAIPEVEFPEHFKAALRTLSDAVADAIKSGQLDLDAGDINVPKTNEEQTKAMFFLTWIRETNDVMKNLEIILSDLHALPKLYLLLPGSPFDRFNFLIKSFFSEFFCLKEVLNRASKSAAAVNLISTKEIEGLRSIFYKRFEEMINIRNRIIHQSANWKGKDYFILAFHDSARKTGHQLIDKESGKDNFEDYLNSICNNFLSDLHAEAANASNIISEFIKIIATQDKELTKKD